MKITHKLQLISIGSCDCLTKTPDIEYHDKFCRYRLITEAIRYIEKLESDDNNEV